VERVLLSHPAVADAGVAPVQRSGQEQVATAFVVLAPGAQATQQELLAWCREHLTAHQVPAHVTFTGRLPRNSVGKLIRAGLQNAATPRAARPPGVQRFGKVSEVLRADLRRVLRVLRV